MSHHKISFMNSIKTEFIHIDIIQIQTIDGRKQDRVYVLLHDIF